MRVDNSSIHRARHDSARQNCAGLNTIDLVYNPETPGDIVWTVNPETVAENAWVLPSTLLHFDNHLRPE